MSYISDKSGKIILIAALGPASGIINGLGAGGGGTMAGFLVGLLYQSTGSYMTGFVVLGIIVIFGGVSLILYGNVKSKEKSISIAI